MIPVPEVSLWEQERLGGMSESLHIPLQMCVSNG